jgi:hypothetical protein
VPYANLTNPQTLNLYSMVADDPESFADLDGHDGDCCDSVTWSDVGHALHALGTILAGGSIAPSTAAIAGGGITVGAEIEAFDLGVNYPHEPCNCPVDAVNPPYIQAPAQNENTTESTRAQALNVAQQSDPSYF